MRRLAVWMAVALGLVLALAGCGGGDPFGVLVTATPTATSTPTMATATAATWTMMPTPLYTVRCVRTGSPEGWLNVRSGPGVGYAIIGLLKEGTRISTSNEAEEGWYRLATGGWVRAAYVGRCWGDR